MSNRFLFNPFCRNATASYHLLPVLLVAVDKRIDFHKSIASKFTQMKEIYASIFSV